MEMIEVKYKRNQYSEGVSICSLIIAGIFIYWGLNDTLIQPLFYGAVFGWFGLIWLGIAAAILIGQIAAFTNRNKLRNAVLFEYEASPNATIEEISASTGISFRDVQAIVLDLKARGLLRGKFSSETGQMTNVEVASSASQETAPTGVKYCPNCGTAKAKDAAVYCSYCGTKF